MKHYLTIFFAGLILLSFSTCKQKTTVREYYIVSTGDSTDFSNMHSNDDKSLPPPPKFPNPEIDGSQFNYDLVIIFDSTDLVYLYQTDFIENKSSIIKPHRGCVVNMDDDYHKFIKYPVFLGLRTENVLKFNNNTFIDFIKTNNDIFQLDTLRDSPRILFIASNKDTIENSAFYDLMALIKQKRKTINKVHYIIRMTTEEENKIIYCKRRNLEYKPEKIKWTKNFLNGEYSPFTKEYDSIANYVIPVCYKAQNLFKMDTIKMKKY